eukprot:PLAT4699.1.p1 GENE.PLAT4699.1~~PLAT4699.1.p1  ORF type:complete len:957 (-),score=453.78 PLAT4699.1:334-3144(-)
MEVRVGTRYTRGLHTRDERVARELKAFEEETREKKVARVEAAAVRARSSRAAIWPHVEWFWLLLRRFEQESGLPRTRDGTPIILARLTATVHRQPSTRMRRARAVALFLSQLRLSPPEEKRLGQLMRLIAARRLLLDEVCAAHSTAAAAAAAAAGVPLTKPSGDSEPLSLEDKLAALKASRQVDARELLAMVRVLSHPRESGRARLQFMFATFSEDGQLLPWQALPLLFLQTPVDSSEAADCCAALAIAQRSLLSLAAARAGRPEGSSWRPRHIRLAEFTEMLLVARPACRAVEAACWRRVPSAIRLELLAADAGEAEAVVEARHEARMTVTARAHARQARMARCWRLWQAARLAGRAARAHAAHSRKWARRHALRHWRAFAAIARQLRAHAAASQLARAHYARKLQARVLLALQRAMSLLARVRDVELSRRLQLAKGLQRGWGQRRCRRIMLAWSLWAKQVRAERRALVFHNQSMRLWCFRRWQRNADRLRAARIEEDRQARLRQAALFRELEAAEKAAQQAAAAESAAEAERRREAAAIAAAKIEAEKVEAEKAARWREAQERAEELYRVKRREEARIARMKAAEQAERDEQEAEIRERHETDVARQMEALRSHLQTWLETPEGKYEVEDERRRLGQKDHVLSERSEWVTLYDDLYDDKIFRNSKSEKEYSSQTMTRAVGRRIAADNLIALKLDRMYAEMLAAMEEELLAWRRYHAARRIQRVIKRHLARKRLQEAVWKSAMRRRRRLVGAETEMTVGAAIVIQRNWRRFSARRAFRNHVLSLYSYNVDGQLIVAATGAVLPERPALLRSLQTKRQAGKEAVAARRAIVAACKLQALWRGRAARKALLSLLTGMYSKRYDLEHDAVYYYHRGTGESTWEAPPLARSLAAARWVVAYPADGSPPLYVDCESGERSADAPPGYRICQRCGLEFAQR